MSRIIWIVVIFVIVGFVLSVIQDIRESKLKERKRELIWMTVDALARAQSEFRAYVDACEQLAGCREATGFDGDPQTHNALSTRLAETRAKLASALSRPNR